MRRRRAQCRGRTEPVDSARCASAPPAGPGDWISRPFDRVMATAEPSRRRRTLVAHLTQRGCGVARDSSIARWPIGCVARRRRLAGVGHAGPRARARPPVSALPGPIASRTDQQAAADATSSGSRAERRDLAAPGASAPPILAGEHIGRVRPDRPSGARLLVPRAGVDQIGRNGSFPRPTCRRCSWRENRTVQTERLFDLTNIR